MDSSSDIKNVGDYFNFTIGKESIIHLMNEISNIDFLKKLYIYIDYTIYN